jgi:hypothetical protein
LVKALVRKVDTCPETGWEPGDHLAVYRTAADRLRLPEAMRHGELDLAGLVDPDGRPMAFDRANGSDEILLSGLNGWALDSCRVWFEYPNILTRSWPTSARIPRR